MVAVIDATRLTATIHCQTEFNQRGKFSFQIFEAAWFSFVQKGFFGENHFYYVKLQKDLQIKAAEIKILRSYFVLSSFQCEMKTDDARLVKEGFRYK